jgi:hypothetical protein
VRAGSVATTYSTVQTSFTAGRSAAGGSFGPAGPGYTFSQLLQDLNEVVPLETQPDTVPNGTTESGHWALEDYVVEFQGSECLHFMEVDALLRDEDEVMYGFILL